MTEPEALSSLRDRLRSEDRDERLSALSLVRVHGPAARSLAPEVAVLIDDGDSSIQYAAVVAFRAIGGNAVDAVDPLVALLGKSDPLARERAASALGVVGGAAGAAIPALLALIEGGDDRSSALEALIHITTAPDEAVARAVEAGLLDENFAIAMSCARAVAGASASWLAERALLLAEARAGDEPAAMSAMTIVMELARRFPERALPLARAAIERKSAAAGLALIALERIDAPVSHDLGLAIFTLAASEPERDHVSSIERMGPRFPAEALSSHARALLVPELQRGATLRQAAGIARLLASVTGMVPEAVPSLLVELRRGLDRKRPPFYQIGAIAEALGTLADVAQGDAVALALDFARVVSRAHLRRDHSAVLDFQRAVRRGLGRLAPRSLRAMRALDVDDDASVIDRADREADEAVLELPRIPSSRSLPPPARMRVRRAKKHELAQLERALAAGRKLCDREVPDEIAAFVDAEVRELRRHHTFDESKIAPLAALYGDALARELGWSWRLWKHGDLRALAVVAPRDTHLVLPGKLVRAKLQPGAEITLLLMFRMLQQSPPTSHTGALQLLY